MDQSDAFRIILAVSLILVLIPRVARFPHPWGRRIRYAGAALLAAGLIWAIVESALWFAAR